MFRVSLVPIFSYYCCNYTIALRQAFLPGFSLCSLYF